jgi:hypothetical protein
MVVMVVMEMMVVMAVMSVWTWMFSKLLAVVNRQ